MTWNSKERKEEFIVKILVTGGTGFIGSHTTVELLDAGYEVVIIDDLSNSKCEVLDKIEAISKKRPSFYEGDVRDKELLNKIFADHKIDAAIDFAAYKAVGESVAKPLMYYQNNLNCLMTLCEVMQEHDCKNLVFSSSATVYGDPEKMPITEDSPLSTTNPYGTTKLYGEQILRDLHVSDPAWSIAILRYFNPIGAHESGLIGENPNDIPNNLMPYICKVANKELPYLNVFGDDYATPDGTGVRDYIHVVDLAKGHISALEAICNTHKISAYNLGTGTGYSVLDMVNAYSQINDVEVPYKIVARRPGDIAECYADTEKAAKELHWRAEKDLTQMCKDAYRFIQNYQK